MFAYKRSIIDQNLEGITYLIRLPCPWEVQNWNEHGGLNFWATPSKFWKKWYFSKIFKWHYYHFWKFWLLQKFQKMYPSYPSRWREVLGLDQFRAKYIKLKGLTPATPSQSLQFSKIMDLEYHSQSKMLWVW